MRKEAPCSWACSSSIQDLAEMKRKVRLVMGNSQRWVDFQVSRERRLGVVRSAFFLMNCGIRFSIEHFAHLLIESNLKKTVSAFQCWRPIQKNI